MPKLSKRSRKYRKPKRGGEKLNVELSGNKERKTKIQLAEAASETVDAARAANGGFGEDDFD